MEATALTAGLPSASSWYMNPYFMATFGAVVALGLVLFGVSYFVFVKLRVGQSQSAIKPEDRCNSCGLTGDMITRLIPCKDHSGLSSRVETIDKWIASHEGDYRELRKRIDDIERRNRTRD